MGWAAHAPFGPSPLLRAAIALALALQASLIPLMVADHVEARLARVAVASQLTGPPSQVLIDGHLVRGGNAVAREVLSDALADFRRMPGSLPPLRIFFHGTRQGCSGHLGLFNGDGSGARIDLCTGSQWVIAHELAHAWEYHNVTPEAREVFMAYGGYDIWNAPGARPEILGVEAAANVIAWGAVGPPLTDPTREDLDERLHRFEMLVGRPSPRAIR